MLKFNALFSYLRVEIAKIKPGEILSRQNREIKYQQGNLCLVKFHQTMKVPDSTTDHVVTGNDI